MKKVLVKEKLNCDTVPKKASTHSMGSLELEWKLFHIGKWSDFLISTLISFRWRLPIIEVGMNLGKTYDLGLSQSNLPKGQEAETYLLTALPESGEIIPSFKGHLSSTSQYLFPWGKAKAEWHQNITLLKQLTWICTIRSTDFTISEYSFVLSYSLICFLDFCILLH